MDRNDRYKPGIARLALVGLLGTLLLIYAGAFTTTIEAGMVFEDWPLSNGSLNPEGWTQNIAMLAEHSHRLLGMFVGLVTVAMMVWVFLAESRTWVRGLAVAAFLVVTIQGLLGGFRVLENSDRAAMVHGVLAQITVCVLVSLALSCSKLWFNFNPVSADPRQIRKIRGFGIGLVASIVIQLIIGAEVRHSNAGLAMPTFPLPLLPESFNHLTGIHFLHRVIGVLIFIKVLLFAKKALGKGAPQDCGFRALVSVVVISVFAQIALGALTIWTLRQPIVTTLHVVNGAILLTTAWASVFLLYRNKEASSPKSVAAASVA